MACGPHGVGVVDVARRIPVRRRNRAAREDAAVVLVGDDVSRRQLADRVVVEVPEDRRVAVVRRRVLLCWWGEIGCPPCSAADSEFVKTALYRTVVIEESEWSGGYSRPSCWDATCLSVRANVVTAIDEATNRRAVVRQGNMCRHIRGEV